MPEYYFEGNPGQTYTGPLTSAQYNDIINGGNVQDLSGSNIQGVYGRVNQLADWLAEYSQKATTFNAREAATLRSWQEEQNRKAMEFSAQQAASNREWQEYMSNTAHQREIADLKAAGLNPILSVNGGAGASTPSGSYAQGVSSAGAKAEFDTSASGSLVNLLGSMLSSMTQIADTATNAQANLAYADIMSTASELVAGINRSAVLGSASIAADASVKGKEIEQEGASARQDDKQEHEIFMAGNYPTTLAGVLNGMVDAFANGRDNNFINAAKTLFGMITGSGSSGSSKRGSSNRGSSNSSYTPGPQNSWSEITGHYGKMWKGILD